MKHRVLLRINSKVFPTKPFIFDKPETYHYVIEMIYLSKNNEAIEQMLSHLETDITPIEQKK